MAEISRSRVTITLGRSGQVVKRAGQLRNSGSSDAHLAVGSKRSVRERIGSDADGIQVNDKRQRGDSNELMMKGANGLDDARLGKNDLRFKLRRKNVARQVEDYPRNGMDLRHMLSRAVQPSSTSGSLLQRPPEPTDSMHFVPERKDLSTLGRIPSTRSTDAFLQMDSLRNSYSPWTLESLRQRSPDRVIRTSRNLSPPRNEEQSGKRPLVRAYDDARTVSYMNRVILDPGRPIATGTASYMTRARPTVSGESMRPVVPLPAPPLPPNGILQKSSYTLQGNEHLTVDCLLHSLGLEKYAIYFKAEEVDMTALKQMGDNDLKDLGIPMGPRKKIQLALLPRSKRQLV